MSIFSDIAEIRKDQDATLSLLQKPNPALEKIVELLAEMSVVQANIAASAKIVADYVSKLPPPPDETPVALDVTKQ